LFIWDETNRRKIRQHRLSPEQVVESLNDPAAVIFEARIVNGVQRYTQIGALRDGRLLDVVYENYAEDIRVVTAFRPSADEREFYEEQ